MAGQEITAVGPAFAAYLRRFRGSFLQDRTAAHFGTSRRGPRSDLPRTTAEPIALEAGAAVRTLQEFLATSKWDHDRARDTLPRHPADVITGVPADGGGTVGAVDETSGRKWGDHTPGVRRQYLGCVGEVEHGIATAHVGVARGTFQALLDADLYLPKGWADDRPRCRAAGTPGDVRYRAEWRVPVGQLPRLDGNGVRFDWLTFDAGSGAAVPFLTFLGWVRRKFVAEVPVDFAVRDAAGGRPRRADARLAAAGARGGGTGSPTGRSGRRSGGRRRPGCGWPAGSTPWRRPSTRPRPRSSTSRPTPRPSRSGGCGPSPSVGGRWNMPSG